MSKFDVVVMSDELAECEDYQDWSELRRLESQESIDANYHDVDDPASWNEPSHTVLNYFGQEL